MKTKYFGRLWLGLAMGLGGLVPGFVPNASGDITVEHVATTPDGEVITSFVYQGGRKSKRHRSTASDLVLPDLRSILAPVPPQLRLHIQKGLGGLTLNPQAPVVDPHRIEPPVVPDVSVSEPSRRAAVPEGRREDTGEASPRRNAVPSSPEAPRFGYGSGSGNPVEPVDPVTPPFGSGGGGSDSVVSNAEPVPRRAPAQSPVPRAPAPEEYVAPPVLETIPVPELPDLEIPFSHGYFPRSFHLQVPHPPVPFFGGRCRPGGFSLFSGHGSKRFSLRLSF